MKDPKNIKITFNPEFLEALRIRLSRYDEQKQKATQRLNEVLFEDLESVCASYEALEALMSSANDPSLEHAAILLSNLNDKLTTCFGTLKDIESVLSK